MSFSGTPLGQGRRLDHQTFLGKPPSNGNRPTSPQRLIPASYTYGAPTPGSRSPTKPLSPVKPPNTFTNEKDDENDPALARFARIKQREQVLSSRPGGPKVITSPPKPEKWSVKDTTVNIATAFTQAASDMQSIPNPNNSWASGSSRPNPIVPRSSSVEYENQAQAATTSRRLAAPPSRTAAPRSTAARKPISKSGSSLHVPDSEGEEDRNTRAKSPFGEILDSAKRLLGPATYYLQQRPSEPGEQSLEEPQPSTNGDDPSYDYAAEEREFQAAQQSNRTNNATHTHKRNRMSMDNKAYKPSASDVEEDDDGPSDDGKGKKKKKKKKKDAVGLVNTLPSLTYDKRKKKKGKGGKGAVAEAEESDGEGSESDDQTTDKQSIHLDPSIARSSIPPSTRHSLPRQSIPPDLLDNDILDTSLEDQQGLHSIPEVDEEQLMPELSHNTHRRRSTSRPPSSRIGGPLGSLVHLTMQATRWLLVHGISTVTYFLGLIFGTIFSLFTTRPRRMFSEARRLGLFASVPKYVVLGLTLSMAWYFLRDPMWQHMPHWPTGHVYTAPEAPAANIVELAARLQRIENALSGISLDTEKGKVRAENEAKSHMELVGRLGTLESKVVAESKKAAEAEVQYRNVAREGLKVVRQEVEALQAQVHQQQQHRHQEKSDVTGSDEETRAKLKALEERVGSMESGVKDALELGKKAGNSAGTGSAWWSKLASGSASKAGLTIKSSDGQDVSGLIGHLVDSAVSLYNKDILARPDYAQHTNGAFIIPTLTSPTYELRPSTLRGHIIGVLTGAPFPIGRSPLNALHHDLHSGYCWPFPGTEGQLALSLAAPIYITDVTIDHVAREVALDIRTAPREMELWGLVEGKDNIAKVKEWMTEKAKRKEEAKERGEEVEEEEYPKTLPKSQQYIRVANFSYDIHAPSNVQTFPVLPEIRELGVDFAIVALRVKSNWGRNDFTCLYRLRVHGERLGEKQPPYFEESA